MGERHDQQEGITMQSYYTETVGVSLPIVLQDGNGGPISLASRTVTISLYAFGTNTLAWTHTATVDDAANGLAHYTLVAGDFATAGDYFSLIVVTGTGYSQTFVGDSYKVIAGQQTSVTVPDFLAWLQIPQSDAKSANTMQLYIDQADQQLLLEVPTLATATDQKIIQFRLHCVRLGAAVFYYLNLGEASINPDVRLEKIKTFSQLYKKAVDSLNSALSSTLDDTSTVRRVYNNSEADISPLSSSYTP